MARAAACAVVAGGAALALTSCTLLGLAPGAPAPADSGPVVDPSVPSAGPAATVTATPSTSPSPSDLPTATPSVTPSVTATPVAARTAVTPFITSATVSTGALDVSAIVPKIVERGGTCTLTATKGGTVRTAHADAAAASSYTGCEPLSISGLAAGTWQVRVSYASTQSAGDSAGRSVTAG